MEIMDIITVNKEKKVKKKKQIYPIKLIFNANKTLL